MMIIVLLLLGSQHASGVEVYEGEESVLLPCQVQADVSRISTSAVWNRDGFKNPTVHLRLQKIDDLDERDDLSGQNDLYQHRTSMRVDALQTGDLSLTLKNPRVSDSGTYTCTALKAGQAQRQTQVQLKVTEPPAVLPKVLAAVPGALIILAAFIGLFVYCAHRRMKKRSEALQPEKVEVTQGDESVLLPFKTTADLPQDVTVEWRHNNMKVHVYESGKNQPDKQHQGYRGRTEMDEDPLRTKDLSLTLKHPCYIDSGVYTCTVYNKDGDMLTQRSVIVRFRDVDVKEVQVSQGDKSALLSFETKVVLPQDVTVEWRRSDNNNMIVHVYESGNNQPDKQDEGYRNRTEMKEDALRTGDLSLTLKGPHLTDSGAYVCSVYNKHGHIVLHKIVILRLEAHELQTVSVTQGESVLLPFTTTADLSQDIKVEWTRSVSKHTKVCNMKVHVYESGNNQPDKQDQGYRGRTEMDEDPLRNKDFSLTLKKPLLTDSGLYTCTVYDKDGNMTKQKSVTLSVTVPQAKLVEVTQGEKSVLLLFKPTADLPQDITVKWTHNNIQVHMYESVKNQLDKQDGYRGRTEMNEDPLTNKDFSLTLKEPLLTDRGVYTCTIYKDEDKLLQISVILRVRAVQTELMEVPLGVKSVLLPFKPTADFPQGVTVEWTDSKHRKVHVYESGNNQPDKQDQSFRRRTEMNEDPLTNKDLSLTLKHLRLTDSAVYTCTVYNKDRHMLLQKSVTLIVRENQPKEVEVLHGEESVQLRFKIPPDLPQDLTVEWTRSVSKHTKVNNMKVHVYESGKHQPGKQDEDYRSRTEMDEDPLSTGDLSLTLKDLRLTDSGVYTCTVKKDGHMLLERAVTLRVRATLMGTVDEMLSHCPCSKQTRAQQAQPDQEHRNRSHEDVPLMEVQSA